MKIKKMTKAQREREIASLNQLAESYKNRPKSRKRVIIPFELELGNFCCEKLHKEFKDNRCVIMIEQIGSKFYAWLSDSKHAKNYCPYCSKLIDDFFYIKEY
jgi:hypothetical protein